MIRIPLTKNDFKRILSKYSIGEYISHRHIPLALANTVFLVRTSRAKYILKIVEENKLSMTQFQLKVQEFLIKKKMPIPRIEHTKKRTNILDYKRKRIIIQNFLEGSHPKRFNDSLLRQMAATFGRLNKILLEYPLEGKHVWTMDYEFMPSKTKFQDYFGFDFQYEEKKLLNDMKKIDRSKLRRSVLHSDLNGINMLVKNNKITAIIDWDDCHEDYIALDVAVIILNTCISSKKVSKEKMHLFFSEYQKHLKLNLEERKAIYYFMKTRLLGTINWLKKQCKRHPDRKKYLEEHIKEKIRCYRTLDRLSLKEFMKLNS